LGNDGLKPFKPSRPRRPNQTPLDVEYRILIYVLDFPTHGPKRIVNELAKADYGPIEIGHTAVYNVLRRHNLNTRTKRLEWLRKSCGQVISPSELERDKQASRQNHVEASYPGQLVGLDTFYVGCIKGLGRIYQMTACDCFSIFGWAKVYLVKKVTSSIDFKEFHLLRRTGWVRIERILTDNGKEFTTHWKGGKHKFEDALAKTGIRHSYTKVKHPWTNGYSERLNQTILDEFYSVAFRKKIYRSLEELQKDLDEFMYRYNDHRAHQGYKLKEGGYTTPSQAFYNSKRCVCLPLRNHLKGSGERTVSLQSVNTLTS
jgi:transposase InsO family protein